MESLAPGAYTARIGDIDMYYEIRGSGPLMVVQNGVWGTSFTIEATVDEAQLPPDVEPGSLPHMLGGRLTERFTVLEMDGRGTGRTTLGRGPANYGRYADDTIRLLDHLGVESAHFYGHSDGGCIELVLLLNHPERVRTATLSGTPYSHEAYTEATRDWFEGWYAEIVAGKPAVDPIGITDLYLRESPEPHRLAEYLAHQRLCWSTEPNFSLRQLTGISRPVLVIDAGRDEHIDSAQFVAMGEAIPGAEIVSFPTLGHDYSTPTLQAEVVAAIAEFVARNG